MNPTILFLNSFGVFIESLALLVLGQILKYLLIILSIFKDYIITKIIIDNYSIY